MTLKQKILLLFFIGAFGFLGSENRLNATVISDTVNTASRIENLCKTFSASLLVSERAIYGYRLNYENRLIGSIDIRGKNKPVNIYEIFEGNSKRIIDIKNSTKIIFERGLLFLEHKNYSEAKIEMEKVLHIDPRDKCAAYYLNLIESR